MIGQQTFGGVGNQDGVADIGIAGADFFHGQVVGQMAWADDFKRNKIETLALMLKAVLDAEGRVVLMMNVPKERMQEIIDALPALRRPTVSPLVDSDWVALMTVIEETVVRDLIPQLKEMGAEGICEYLLNKIVE